MPDWGAGGRCSARRYLLFGVSWLAASRRRMIDLLSAISLSSRTTFGPQRFRLDLPRRLSSRGSRDASARYQADRGRRTRWVWPAYGFSRSARAGTSRPAGYRARAPPTLRPPAFLMRRGRKPRRRRDSRRPPGRGDGAAIVMS